MKKITIEERKVIDKWWDAIQNVQNKNRHITEWTQFKFACLNDLKDIEKDIASNELNYFV